MRARPRTTSRRSQHLYRGIAAGAFLAVSALGLPAAVAAHATAVGDSTTRVSAPGAGTNATVTVSDTHDLVNQSVTVSWKGFKPSSQPVLSNGSGTYDQTTQNPVRVYECRGSDPASSSDCYGSPGFPGIPEVDNGTTTYPAVPAVPGYTYSGQTSAFEQNPDGPANFEDTVSDANGSGSVVIQIFTTLESPTLGCAPNRPCSIAVVPNYGRDAGPGAATEGNLDAPWAWADRTVVPLSFAQVGQTCTLSKTPLTVEGAPIDARLMASWQVGACHAKTGSVDANYTSIGEPQTRGDFTSGITNVGLTIRPLDPAPATSPVYAPFSLTSLVVAFQVDDANGRPVTSMKLDARLVAKIITASYRVADDPNVSSTAPFNLFHDPEFLQLNPNVHWPSGTPGNHPILLADQSDLTWELTSWLNSDPAARAFLNGKPDPWGMTVNAAYKGIKLPVQNFPSLDEDQANAFLPIQGLDQVAHQLSIAQFPGGTTEIDDGQTVVSKYQRQNPGGHEIIGIVDAADASAFLLHTAALENAAGKFVSPTNVAVLAAESHMSVSPDKVTRQPDFTSKDAASYPLPVVTTALLPIGAAKAQATSIARLLTYSSSAGQQQGAALGQLPVGYVPLPTSLLKQDRAAIQAVLGTGQTGRGTKQRHHHGGKSTGASTHQSASSGTTSTDAGLPPVDVPTPSGSSVSSAAPTTSGGAPVVASVLAAVKSATSASTTLPGLLALGLAGFLAGPLIIWGRRTTRLAHLNWRSVWPRR